MSCPGRKIVCGGTTSQIVGREIGEEILVSLTYYNAEVPPTGEIKGIDLVTEGVVTLGKALEIIRTFTNAQHITQTLRLDKKDGASRLANMLMEESTQVSFLVGRAINPAHQNPDLPISLSIKMRLVEDIAACLRQAGKEVDIAYY
jgi:hypothetical protein